MMILDWLSRLFKRASKSPDDPLADLSVIEQNDLAAIPPIPPGQCWATWPVYSPFGDEKQATVQILEEHCRRKRLRYILDQRMAQVKKGASIGRVTISAKAPKGFEEAVQ